MIETILIEDEIQSREGLKRILSLVAPDVKIVGETGYVSKAIELIKIKKPKLIFLDIELKEGTGFDILDSLKGEIDFKIIFVTAYNQFAIDAFKFSTIDYLLKPINPQELKAAINKAIITIKEQQQQEELLSVLKNNLDKKEKKIVIKTTTQNYIVPLKDIIRLEADAAYTNFITTKDEIVTSRNINYYIELLGGDFIRSHQSHLVNSTHVLSLTKKGLLLSNKELIPVSTRKKTEITKLVNKL